MFLVVVFPCIFISMSFCIFCCQIGEGVQLSVRLSKLYNNEDHVLCKMVLTRSAPMKYIHLWRSHTVITMLLPCILYLVRSHNLPDLICIFFRWWWALYPYLIMHISFIDNRFMHFYLMRCRWNMIMYWIVIEVSSRQLTCWWINNKIGFCWYSYMWCRSRDLQ